MITALATLILTAAVAFLVATHLAGAERTGAWAGRLVRGAAHEPTGRAVLSFIRRHRKSLTIAGITMGLVMLPFLLAATLLVIAVVVAAWGMVYLIESGALASRDGHPEDEDEGVVGWSDPTGGMWTSKAEADMKGNASPIRHWW